jgi:glycosyltransferase involved in cell wall biosynthesis
VLAVSPSLQQYAAQSFRRASVHFAKNPARELDVGSVTARDGEQFRFLNVARLSHQKGLDVLMRALAIARPELPPVTMTLVGSGPEEPHLKRLCRELGLDDVVDFLGYRADPAAYFGAADCFVLSSRWEGFPVVLLEALRFGLPLVATDCRFGPSDLITDSRLGELVPVDVPEALAEGLKRAAQRRTDPADEAFRRAVASEYARGPAARMHFEVLKTIVAAQSATNGRLTALAAA